MKFQREGKDYHIEFQRRKEEVKVTRKGSEKLVSSTFPFTVARLIEVDPKTNTRKVFAEASAGCWHKDKFVKEVGRRMALKNLTARVPRIMRQPLWDAYQNRSAKVKATETK